MRTPRVVLVAPPLSTPLRRGHLFFGWLLCLKSSIGSAESNDAFYIIYFLISQFDAPNDWMVYPPAHRFRRLLVGCCVY
jgi:hypothetical protein